MIENKNSFVILRYSAVKADRKEHEMHNTIAEIMKDRSSKLVVYGLGTTGRLFLDLSAYYGLNIKLCVIGGGVNGPPVYGKIPVLRAEQAMIEPECILVYTVKQPIDKILKAGFKDKFSSVIDISSVEIFDSLLEDFYTRYFREKMRVNEITFNDNRKFISFNGLKLPNEFYTPERKQAFYLEIGDIMLPSIFNDYSRIDEGAYEDQNVSIAKNDIVIDCGANIGLFSAVAAYKGATVIAFEPDERCLGVLRRTADVYKGRIFIQQAAIDKQCGTRSFYLDSGLTGGGCVYDRENGLKEVATESIDHFVGKYGLTHVDFIKADIEGVERDMLLGARKTLRDFAPKLSICTYHNPDDPQVLEQIILEANPEYKIYHKWKKLYAHV